MPAIALQITEDEHTLLTEVWEEEKPNFDSGMSRNKFIKEMLFMQIGRDQEEVELRLLERTYWRLTTRAVAILTIIKWRKEDKDSTKGVQISTRISQDTKRKLEEIAEQEGITVSDLVRQTLDRQFDERSLE